jgi:hypothetical protein
MPSTCPRCGDGAFPQRPLLRPLRREPYRPTTRRALQGPTVSLGAMGDQLFNSLSLFPRSACGSFERCARGGSALVRCNR